MDIGQTVKIKPPFGDGQTLFLITAKMLMNADGAECSQGQEIAFTQYEIDGVYYAESYLEGVEQ
jgi:hypothetical protein